MPIRLRPAKRSRAVQRELDFDYRIRWLQDGRDPVIEQIFLEFKVIDSKAQSLLTFIGLLLVALVAGSASAITDFAAIAYFTAFGSAGLSALYALASINLLGGHTRFVRRLFDAELSDDERLEYAQTLFAQVAVGRRRRYLKGYWLAHIAVVLAAIALFAQHYSATD